MPEAEERALIGEATEAFKRHEGAGPAGWLGPWISESAVTPDLLAEAGYRYVLDWPIDDQPVWMRTRAGRLLSMPYPIEINDTPAMLTRRHTAPDFAEMIIDHFEEMLEQSRRAPLVCGLSLHTFCSGVPFRLRQLRRALRHIAGHPQRDRIWITRPRNILAHIESLPPGTVPEDSEA
jgi:hypothetical protein